MRQIYFLVQLSSLFLFSPEVTLIRDQGWINGWCIWPLKAKRNVRLWFVTKNFASPTLNSGRNRCRSKNLFVRSNLFYLCSEFFSSTCILRSSFLWFSVVTWSRKLWTSFSCSFCWESWTYQISNKNTFYQQCKLHDQSKVVSKEYCGIKNWDVTY